LLGHGKWLRFHKRDQTLIRRRVTPFRSFRLVVEESLPPPHGGLPR
jgi:hypothetical protein